MLAKQSKLLLHIRDSEHLRDLRILEHPSYHRNAEDAMKEADHGILVSLLRAPSTSAFHQAST